MDQKKEKKRFSLIARIKSTNHAWRGVGILIRTTHNFWLHIFFTLCVVYLGLVLCISEAEWLALVLSIGLVIVAETINTALEIDMDLTSPEYHPYARDTKDVAAGAVLLAAFFAIIVGLLIFWPKVLLLI